MQDTTLNLTQDQQNKIVTHIKDVFADYKDKMASYRNSMYDVYTAVNEFKRKVSTPKELEDPTKVRFEYLVNKAFEVENKVLPKVFGNKPNWIVTAKPTYDAGEMNIMEMADMVRDYLEDQYKKQDIRETLKLVCKGGVRYGNSYGKVEYKYKIDRTKQNETGVSYDEMGNEVESIKTVVREGVAEEYPCIEYKGRNDLYFDPSYLRLEDMPAVIELASRVRLSYFTQHKDDYINVDKIIECVKRPDENDDDYKTRILSLLGIQISDSANIIKDTVSVKKYYGYLDLSDKNDAKNEKLYEFRVVNDLIVVHAKEISYFPFEDFRVFIDTETYFAKGYLQSIIALQNELNHQKIAVQKYINKIINPPVYYSPNSGIDPRVLVDVKPGQIIPTTKDGQTALANTPQYPFRDIQPGYWNNQNDIERQIQAVTFTIDTANPLSQQSLTNTATGARIKEFESNAVTGDTRREFEDFMARIAYKMLQAAYDNMDENIKVPKKDGTGYREVNKEAFKNALSKYDIRIEAGSSSFDSLEQRRDDALAQFNLGMQAAQAGVPVDLKYLFKRVLENFEGVDTERLFIQDLSLPQVNAPVQPAQVSA